MYIILVIKYSILRYTKDSENLLNLFMEPVANGAFTGPLQN